MARVTGTVKRFFSEKGFGFISPHDGSEDVFVHMNNIEMDGFRCLNEGDEVEFESQYDASRGKTKAIAVTGLGGAQLQGGGGSGKGKGGGGYQGGYGGGKGGGFY